MSLGILLPNGQVLAVQVYIDTGSGPVEWDGSVTASIPSPVSVTISGPLGQALAAASLPVVLTAAQLATLTPPAALTNYANETGGNLTTIAGKDFATQTTLALIKAKTDNIDVALSTRTKPADIQSVSVVSLPLPSGAATETTLGTRLSESDFDTKTGSLTETAPSTDTASSGLNGRLQRIAQRITSLITALGSPFQAGGSIGNTTFASTIADGANAVEGTTTGAKVITDANGTIQQYLRGLIYQLITLGASFFTPTPGTTGGWSVFNATSGDGSTALTNSAQAVKGSQGTLGGWYVYNPNAVACYVVIYNVIAASVVVGTTNPAMILTIPATSAANLELTNGIQFGTAIAVAAVMTTAGGNTAPTTALEANFWYK